MSDFALEVQIPFQIGKVVVTPKAYNAVSMARISQCLARHEQGDWGITDPEDAASNDYASSHQHYKMVLSAWAIDQTKPCKGYGDNTLWIITESDWSLTTVLLPDEY